MRPYLIAAAVAVAFLAGCGQDNPAKTSDTSMPKGPQTASGGATGTSPNPAPAGEKIQVPPAPTPSATGENKPDPGDANDHSNPQHDAKAKKKNGD